MATPSALLGEELSVSECWALLRTVPIGRLALRDGEEIEVFPVNHLVDGGTIVFRTAHGTKLQLIGDGTLCTYEADQLVEDERLVWSVVLKGSARPVRGHDEVVATFDMEVLTWQSGPKPTYVRITPHSITGRRFPMLTQ